jgi:oligopeptide/dipeptide ABC transporter ATP-binding protein
LQKESNDPIISVQDLSVRFYLGAGVVNAVEHLSFNVRRGASFGIVGESGSGKTVTALTIMGLLARPPGRVDSGTISYNGIDLLKLKDEEMRRIRGKRIAMVYQDPMTSLNPVLRVGFQIAETLMVHEKIARHQAEARAVELMESMGIPEAEKRTKEYPHQFSGGMRQRIMIAMALATNPDLLIADEPTTALDVITQSQILGLLRDLERKRNMTVVLITHDLGIVAQVCDEALVMYAGHGMERGSIQDIFSKPKHPYTRGLLESTTRADREIERLSSIPGTIPDLINPPVGCRFQPRCPVAYDRCSKQEPPPFSQNSDAYSKCWQSEPS